jgi:hypothetical protein
MDRQGGLCWYIAVIKEVPEKLRMRSSDGLEQTKLWVDLIAGVSVIATMVFIALQWNEMKTGGIDTHDLAIAAKGQADAATKISEAASQFSKSADGITTNVAAAVDAMGRNAEAAKSSAETAKQILASSQKQFEIEERPYLYFVPSDLNSILPNKFWGTDAQQGSIKINVGLINEGRTPAVDFRGPEPMLLVSRDSSAPIIGINTHIGAGDTVATTGPSSPGRVFTAINRDHISANELEEIRTGKRFIFVVGAGEYASQYKPGTLYCASYCFMYNPTGYPFRACSVPTTTCEEIARNSVES